ncbi:protein SCD6-like [Lycium barbarum]|uniref:protein SCD6-like n=1 Tax=Lycium barbarum TaxID=112863 RepID=UPI00293E2706|nr:protein SCD6-like [Lycium barbarum]
MSGNNKSINPNTKAHDKIQQNNTNIKVQHYNTQNMTVDSQNSYQQNTNREPTNNQDDKQTQVMKHNHPIDPGEAQNNYLKLISGTSLEEDQDNSDVYVSKQDLHSESSFEDEEGDVDGSSDDRDYELEMSSEVSDEYASVDSESLHDNENASSDEHANILVESFCSQTLVDVDITDFDNVIDKIHLSPRGRGRGRGRGRNNNRGGRQSTRGRGGRGTYQIPVDNTQEMNLSN